MFNWIKSIITPEHTNLRCDKAADLYGTHHDLKANHMGSIKRGLRF